jgi:hypothetical protein
MQYRVVSLETPNELLWANEGRELARVMQSLPTPKGEAQFKPVVRTRAGNLIRRRSL